MQMRLSIFSASLVLAFISATTQASNLFVTPSGSGILCSVDEPCAKVQTAIDGAQTGDHIYIGPGTYRENLTVNADKTDLHISGTGNDQVFVVSAGGNTKPKVSPEGVQMDIVLDIFASGVIVEKLSLMHPPGQADKRDIGIFVRPGAHGVVIQKTHIERQRSGDMLEPTTPGSRGILVVRAPGTHIVKNEIGGNYQDHIHLPSSHSVVMKNAISHATRLGIVVVQENPDSDNSKNHISKNWISDSGSDAIQIQGDHNVVTNNHIRNSDGAAITLCGVGTSCAPPGDSASADDNTVHDNVLEGNNMEVVDGGMNNDVTP